MVLKISLFVVYVFMISKKLARKHLGHSPLLKMVKHITPQDTEADEAWNMVKQEYETCQKEDWATKATVTVINSILFHRRVYFVLSRDGLRGLLKTDPNWEKPIGLKNENYSFLLSRFYCGLIEKVEDRTVPFTGRNLTIYKVIDKDILRFLSIEPEKQLDEVRKYIDTYEGNKKYKNPLTKEELVAIWGFARENNKKEWKESEDMIESDKEESVSKGNEIQKKLFKKEYKKCMEDKTILAERLKIIKERKK